MMKRKIVMDEEVLSKVCVEATIEEGKEIAADLIDTAKGSKRAAAGLAANQIGILKRVIIVKWGNIFIPMINPVLIEAYGKRVCSSEGCLSRPPNETIDAWRYKTVKIGYMNLNGDENKMTLKRFDAFVFQHEMDHLNGVLI